MMVCGNGLSNFAVERTAGSVQPGRSVTDQTGNRVTLGETAISTQRAGSMRS